MDLRHLRYFVAIAETKTMAEASSCVFVTQSTLSHQLAQLEAELGCELFERIGRNLRLTAAGREFLGHARGVLLQVAAAKQALSSSSGELSGVLRVGVIHSFVTGLMPQVASAFLKSYPRVKLQIIELTGVDIEAQVADGTLDLGMAFYPPTSSAVMGERLFDDRLKLAIPVTYPLSKKKAVRFSQLSDLPLAMLGPRFTTRLLLDGYFQLAGVRPNIVVEIDSVDALKRIVEEGVAAAFLPAKFTQRVAKAHLLDVLDPKPSRAAGLVWRRSTYRSPVSTAFVETLSAAIGRLQ